MPDSGASCGHAVCCMSPPFTESTQRGRGLGSPQQRVCEVEILQDRHQPEQTQSVGTVGPSQAAVPCLHLVQLARAAQPAGAGQRAPEWAGGGSIRGGCGAGRKLPGFQKVATVKAPWT